MRPVDYISKADRKGYGLVKKWWASKYIKNGFSNTFLSAVYVRKLPTFLRKFMFLNVTYLYTNTKKQYVQMLR